MAMPMPMPLPTICLSLPCPFLAASCATPTPVLAPQHGAAVVGAAPFLYHKSKAGSSAVARFVASWLHIRLRHIKL